MSDFFQGWRKKIGFLTLVVACLFACGWVRSLSDTDIVEFTKGAATTELFYSFNSSLVVRKVYQDWPNAPWSFNRWDSVPKTQHDFFMDDRITWCWRQSGFGIGKQFDGPGDCSIFVVIPYWSITIPFTLISLYLFLTKPRKSNQNKTDV